MKETPSTWLGATLFACDSFVYVTWRIHIGDMSGADSTPSTKQGASKQIWRIHVKNLNSSCHHVTNVHSSCHKCEWVMSHIRMSHVTYMNESCHIYEWVTQKSSCSVLRGADSKHEHAGDSQLVTRGNFISVWLIRICDMTHSHSWHEWRRLQVRTWSRPPTRDSWHLYVLHYLSISAYGVATISRLLKIIGLFRKRAL